MPYQHGVRVQERATSIVAPITGTAGLQVVFGTAPINMADDPYKVTNTPVIAYNWAEAVSKLGYSEEKDEDGHYLYTLCASMYASFKLVNVAPVIFVNVLDPKKHKKENVEATYPVESMEAVIPITGILPGTVQVKTEADDTALEVETDYVLSFNDDGNLVITLVAGGRGAEATGLKVSSTSIDPTVVDADDIIGASAGSAESGFEVLRQVYPKFGMTPGLIIAPGWSHIPDVGIVLAAKCRRSTVTSPARASWTSTAPPAAAPRTATSRPPKRAPDATASTSWPSGPAWFPAPSSSGTAPSWRH